MSSKENLTVFQLAQKRTGSNFVTDVLAHAYAGSPKSSVIQEPIGLHNSDPHNPLNPWNYSGPEHVSETYGHSKLVNDPYGAIIARQFIGLLKEGSNYFKETDFLNIGWILASAPLKIFVLQRDPRSSIASFKSDNLYSTWKYSEKMLQFAQTIYNNPQLKKLYGASIGSPAQFIRLPEHQQLAFYYAIGRAEIDRNTTGKKILKVDYEHLIKEPIATFEQIFDYLKLPWSDNIENAIRERTTQTRSGGVHGTFRRLEDLIPYTHILNQKQVNDISSILAQFGVILEKPVTPFKKPIQQMEKKEHSNFIQVKNVNQLKESKHIRSYAIHIKNEKQDLSFLASQTLTTNYQYAKFLQWLVDHNIPLAINGKPLFYNDLPQGTIHKKNGRIYVDEKYVNHPVNFINWIGAASYAAWLGGRLPTESEWKHGIANDEYKNPEIYNNGNTGQRFRYTTPVDHFAPDSRGIYDAATNASIWLDADNSTFPYEQKNAGVAWNHTSDRGFINLRPYWLGTSGLSVRPVFPTEYNEINIKKFEEKINELVGLVTKNSEINDRQINSQIFSFFNRIFAYNK